MFAEDEARLLIAEAPSPEELEATVVRRTRGEPLEQVLGWAEFCGLRIVLAPGVFVPRARTEFLVEEAIRLAGGPQSDRPSGSAEPLVVLDICCGTGAAGAALASGREGVELYATDLDPAAIACARRNVEPASGRVFEGDLYEPLPGELRGRVNLLLANAPYVPSDEIELMPREARLHENHAALDGGLDGLEIQRRIAAEAPHWLAPGGRLLIETSQRQAPVTKTIVISAGLEAEVLRNEDLDATLVVGCRPR